MSYNGSFSCTSRQNGNANQIFYLGTNGYNAITFTCSTLSNSYRLTVSDSNQLSFTTTSYTDSSVIFDVYSTLQGHYIKSRKTGRYLCVNQGKVVLEAQLTHRCYWFFEPASSGHASYFLTADDLDDTHNGMVDNCVDYMRQMGYDTERVDLPHWNQPYVTTGVNRITVYHGHGGPGFISISQPVGARMYSENVPSGQYRSQAVSPIANSNSYIVFISCHSAEDAADRRSLVEVAYESGANCVTGFANEVAGGERYFEIVFQLMASDPNMTLTKALDEARKRFGNVMDSASPANVHNRVTLGYMDFSFNMN
ncbi:MAG: hypothetical protein NC093_03430 [Alistipes sp.]|nr:hypothetical protein [Alistipes sp.]